VVCSTSIATTNFALFSLVSSRYLTSLKASLDFSTFAQKCRTRPHFKQRQSSSANTPTLQYCNTEISRQNCSNAIFYNITMVESLKTWPLDFPPSLPSQPTHENSVKLSITIPHCNRKTLTNLRLHNFPCFPACFLGQLRQPLHFRHLTIDKLLMSVTIISTTMTQGPLRAPHSTRRLSDAEEALLIELKGPW
jgi:hypothetical protein